MKLLTEEICELDHLYENSGEGKKDLFIEGIFLQSNLVNRNRRKYPKEILSREVNRYMKESVSMRNAFGELNHPTSGPTINLDRVSHLIVDLKEDGNNFIGKAKILETPMGVIAKTIIEGGGKLAVSSRGLGTVKRVGDWMEVQEDFRLATAADIVSNPSAPDAYVEAILEAPDWVYNAATSAWEMKAIVEEIKTKAVRIDENLLLKKLDRALKLLK